MTERERREQGLPLSPTQLAIYEDMQKEAEAMVATLTFPALDSFASLIASMQPALESMQAMQEQIAEAFSYVHGFEETMRQVSEAMARPTTFPVVMPVRSEPIRYVPEREQQPVRLEITEEQCERIGTSVADALVKQGVVMRVYTNTAQIDLRYDRRSRTVTRVVGTDELTHTFTGEEANKRRELFERLATAKRGIDTSVLQQALDCPSTSATYKVIQGLNKEMSEKLGLTMKFAGGGDKGGYRIHEQIAVRIV